METLAMAERVFLRIRNWRNYQHYKDRNPPWIKLHYEILNSEDWVMLADASRVAMMVCMLIASRHEGRVPYNPEYIKRVGHLKTKPDLKLLIDMGFLVDENPMLADASTKTLADDCSETETETETETEKRQRRPPHTPQVGLNGFDNFYQKYPNKVGRLEAERAWKKIKPMNEEVARTITRAIQDQVRSGHFKGADGKLYEPHPATWLNKGRWMDEIKSKIDDEPKYR
jgi:hypothetical protein